MTAIVQPFELRARRRSRAVWLPLGADGVVAMIGAWFVAGSLARLLWGEGEPGLALVVGMFAIACLLVAIHDDTSTQPLRPEKKGIWKLDEPEWELFVEAVERGARGPFDDAATLPALQGRSLGDEGFEELVRDALDELPEFLQRELEHGNVVVLVSDDGHEHRAYGLYRGGTVANAAYVHEVVIFRDTLVRDFGADPGELRRQVAITVRHELAHHLGAYEDDVARLGL